MILLDTTTRSLEVLLSGSVGAQAPWVAAWVDLVGFTPGALTGVTNNAVAVTVVPAPAGVEKRQIKSFYLRNSDPSAIRVTLRYNDNGTTRTLWTPTLAPGDTLQFVDGDGFKVLDQNGNVKQIATSLVARSPWSLTHAGGSGLERWYYANVECAAALTTGAPSANVLRAIPFIAPSRGGVLDRIAIAVTTLLAGNARIGIYRNTSESNLYPSDLLVDSGDLSTATTGVKAATINVSLVPGELYWFAHVGSVAATLRCLTVANASNLLGITSGLGTAQSVGVSRAFTFAALPSPFGAGGAEISAVPIPAIACRFSS